MPSSSSSIVCIATVLAIAGLTACGDDMPPPATPPPPPPPVAATTPPPATVDTTPPPPPAPPKPPLAQLELATLQAAADALNKHDAKAYAALFTSDAIRKSAGRPDAMGRDSIAAAIGDVFARLPDYKFAVSRILQKGNVAVGVWANTGTDSGTGFRGNKPTGRAVGHEGATILWFSDDGLIKEQHVYTDDYAGQLDPKARPGSFRPPPTLHTGPPDVVASSGSPDEDKLAAFGQAYYASFDAHSVDQLLAPVTDESVMVDISAPGEMKGPKAMKAFIQMYFKAIPDVHQMPLTNQWAIGDTLVSEGVTQGTLKGAMGPIRPTGKPVAFHFVDIGQVKDGKLVRFTTYSNSTEFLTQAGVLKPPPADAK